MSPYRKQQLHIPADATREELEEVLETLVDTDILTPEIVNIIFDQIREKFRKSFFEKSVYKDTFVEDPVLKENISSQYLSMKAVLERYGIKTFNMLPWDKIEANLTKDKLVAASTLAQPTLLVIPPVSRSDLIESIITHPVRGQQGSAYPPDIDDDKLWGVAVATRWRAAIVEGVRDVKEHAEIKGSNYKIAKAWLNMYESMGLNVMDDLAAYLILAMKGLAEGKPVDPYTFTILNGKNLNEKVYLSIGCWRGSRLHFNKIKSSSYFDHLRMRGAIWLID